MQVGIGLYLIIAGGVISGLSAIWLRDPAGPITDQGMRITPAVQHRRESEPPEDRWRI